MGGGACGGVECGGGELGEGLFSLFEWDEGKDAGVYGSTGAGWKEVNARRAALRIGYGGPVETGFVEEEEEEEDDFEEEGFESEGSVWEVVGKSRC